MTALIFDTETHKLHGDIIEAAGIGVVFHEIGGNTPLIPTQFDFTKRFKPSEPINIGAMAIHHIVDEDLVKCPSFTRFNFPKEIGVPPASGVNPELCAQVIGFWAFRYSLKL